MYTSVRAVSRPARSVSLALALTLVLGLLVPTVVAPAPAHAVPAPLMPLPDCAFVPTACVPTSNELGLTVSGRLSSGGTATTTMVPTMPACNQHTPPNGWSPALCYTNVETEVLGLCGYIDLRDGQFKLGSCLNLYLDQRLSTYTFESDRWDTVNLGPPRPNCRAEPSFGVYVFGGPANEPNLVWANRGPASLGCRITFTGERPDGLYGPTWVQVRALMRIQESGGTLRGVSTTAWVPIDGDLRDIGPIASFGASDPVAGVVTFTNSSVHPTGLPMTFEWDFGDGTTSATPAETFTHTYNAPGAYTVTLTATTGALSHTVTRVLDLQPPELEVDVSFPGGGSSFSRGSTIPVRVEVSATEIGVGALSGLAFVGAPLQVTPTTTAPVVGGPFPPLGGGTPLAPGESRVLDFDLDAAEVGAFTATSSVQAIDPDGNPVGPAEGAVSGTVVAAGLELDLTASPARAPLGRDVTLTLEVSNPGQTTLSDITLGVELTWEPDDDAAEPSLTDPTPQLVESLTAGASTTAEAVLVASGPGIATITATAVGVDDDTGDPVEAEITIEVEVVSDLIVNSAGDAADDDPGDGVCDTGGTVEVGGSQVPECTLRAAIEEANASGEDTIVFDIAGTPSISPTSPLPAIEGSVHLDATSQPDGTVVLAGGSAGEDADGLVLTGSQATISGLTITGHEGAAIVLAGDGGHRVEGSTIGGSAATGNGSGVVVDSVDNIVGGDEGNAIGDNGSQPPDGEPLVEPPAPGAGEDAVAAQIEDIVGNVVVRPGASATIVGNDLGAGVGVTAFGELGPGGVVIGDNRFTGTAGVLAVGEGPLEVRDNRFTDAVVGVLAIVSGDVSVVDNEIAASGFGVLALGLAEDGQVRIDGNTLTSDAIGVMTIGAAPTSVTGNDVTAPAGVFALMPPGAGTIDDNTITDADVGVMLIAGSGASVSGNTFAMTDDVFSVGIVSIGNETVFGGNQFDDNRFESRIGVWSIGDASPSIRRNTFSAEDGIGLLMIRSQAATIADNVVDGGAAGMLLFNVGGADIRDNRISDTNVGALLLGILPGEDADTPAGDDVPTDPEALWTDLFTGGAPRIGLDWANAVQSLVEIDEQVIYSGPVSSDLNRWTGNHLTDNQIGLLLGGDLDANLIGGSAADGNTIVGNTAAGILLAGTPGPQAVTIRGNVLHGNGTLGAEEIPAGVPDLKLLDESSDGAAWTPLVNDPGDADTGPNGLQNHPVLTTVTADGSSVAGELWSSPSASFEVDLYAATSCHPSGHGGAERWLTSVTVTTDATGRGTFTAGTSVAAGEVVTATATGTGAFADGATSEFSRCAARGQVATTLSEDAEAGDEAVEVSDDTGFEVGDDLVIDPGGPGEEVHTVTGFGSLLLDGPLLGDHPAGTIVLRVRHDAPPLPTCDGVEPVHFVDVVPDSTHAAAIACAGGLGLVQGRGDNRFDPGGVLTRGQLVTIVDRALAASGIELADGPSTFDDTAGSVHEAAIDRLAAAGIVLGTGDGRFDPQRPATRAQVATILDRASTAFLIPYPQQPLRSFTDVGDGPHAGAIGRLGHAEVIRGLAPDGARFAPTTPIRRDQAASLLTRWLADQAERAGVR